MLSDLKDYGYVTGAYLGVNVQNVDETSASMYEVDMIIQECTKQAEQLLVLKKELEDDIAMFSIPEETAEELAEQAAETGTEEAVPTEVTETEGNIEE